MTTVRARARLVFVLAAWIAAAGAPARADEPAVVIHWAYGDAARFVVEGRVVEARTLSAPRPADRWWTNLWRNLRRLVNDEQEGVALVLGVGGREWRAVSDAEGYFRVDAGGHGLPGGWQRVRVATADGRAAVEGGLLIVPAANTLGIVSDVDDTVQVSRVTDTSELLANTLFKNPAQREAVAGAAGFYRRLAAANPAPAAAPIVYLSATPRQLHANVAAFLAHNDFPPGVLLTRKVTDDRSSDPLTDTFAYKTAKIEELFARLPQVRFVLIGDDGEHDPEIYAALRARHPQRVSAVWIRRLHPDPARKRYPDQGDLGAALAAGK